VLVIRKDIAVSDDCSPMQLMIARTLLISTLAGCSKKPGQQ